MSAAPGRPDDGRGRRFAPVAALADHAIRPLRLIGLIARAPLLVAEAEAATGLRVVSRGAPRDPAAALAMLHGCETPRAVAA